MSFLIKPFAVVAAWLAVVSLSEARDYHYTDAHLHYVDFFQETEGMSALLKQMDANRVDHVMITGIPLAKKWHEDEPKRPRYYAGDDADAYWYSATDFYVAAAIGELNDTQRQRFHPFITGFNPVDKNADAHIERLLKLYPGMAGHWRGFHPP